MNLFQVVRRDAKRVRRALDEILAAERRPDNEPGILAARSKLLRLQPKKKLKGFESDSRQQCRRRLFDAAWDGLASNGGAPVMTGEPNHRKLWPRRERRKQARAMAAGEWRRTRAK